MRTKKKGSIWSLIIDWLWLMTLLYYYHQRVSGCGRDPPALQRFGDEWPGVPNVENVNNCC